MPATSNPDARELVLTIRKTQYHAIEQRYFVAVSGNL
jgi:hypothetical protein